MSGHSQRRLCGKADAHRSDGSHHRRGGSVETADGKIPAPPPEEAPCAGGREIENLGNGLSLALSLQALPEIATWGHLST